MLFNSYQFIIFFLPVTLAVFFGIARYSRQLATAWLALASLWFYASWNYPDLYVLLLSIVFNYVAAYWLTKLTSKAKKILLWVSVSTNLLVLGYFKYSNFFIDNWNHVFGQAYSFTEIALPLGISFFIFTQIAFLVDSYRGDVKEFNPIHYLLFVSYFPQLIAGPILYHGVISQFRGDRMYRWHTPDAAIGAVFFASGLVKKVIFADGVVAYVSPVFHAAKNGISVGWADAWLGALAYTVQLYFDFSGYSDMAIGLCLLCRIQIPFNFDSPYQAVNIVDFWRRWHITLSNFLRDYLYIPLGGNRHGEIRRYFNLFTTMLLGGLWHGAGWTFIIWGGLHGIYLVINHAWDWLRKQLGQNLKESTWWGRLVGRAITFVAVVAAWVVFRAENLGGAITILQAMFRLPTSDGDFTFVTTESPIEASLWVTALILIAWFCPNSQYLIGRLKNFIATLELSTYEPERLHSVQIYKIKLLPQWLRDHKTWSYFTIGIVLPLVLIFVAMSESQTVKEFIYFNF